jgi:hypothetical protein
MCTTLEKSIALCAMHYNCSLVIIAGCYYQNNKMNANIVFRKLFVGLSFSFAIILLTPLGIDNVYSQSIPLTNNRTTAQQHAEHIIDNLVISEHIPITGQLASGDYILLMDFTPFVTSIEGHSHIALKVPCNEDGKSKVAIVAGIAPNLNTLDIGNAINNGTLDGNSLDLSDEGNTCLYHTELPNNISDIALVNTSNQTLNFNEGGYPSITVSAHGTAIQHMAASTMTMTNQTSATPS